MARLQKRWIDTMKECLKKRGLVFRETGRMMHDRRVRLGFVRGNLWGIDRGMNPDFDNMP